MKYLDLTHTIHSTIPSWDGTTGFDLPTVFDYNQGTAPDLMRVQEIHFHGAMGTHMDSPAHFVEGAKTIEKLELENLIGDCVVIKVDREADENYVIMPSTVEAFEKEHGTIKPNTLVIFYTGWEKYWETPAQYQNNFKFPSVHEDTAKLLLERNISGLGIDTLSADTGVHGFPVHRAILGAGKYLVENIAHAGELPVTGAKVFVMPLKIKDAVESPVRLVAVV